MKSEDAERTPSLLLRLDVGHMLNTEAPELEMLVPGLIPARQLGVFAAPGGLGKSYLSLLWTMEQAAKGRPTGYLSLEDDKDEMHRRLRSLASQFTSQERERIGHYMRLRELNPESQKLLTATDHWSILAEEFKGCQLLICDTLNRVSGGKDENSAGYMGPVMQSLHMVCKAIGGAVIAIHHTGKGSSEITDKPLDDRLHQDAGRGSSAIGNACRFVITAAYLNEADAEKAGLSLDEARAGNFAAVSLAKANGVKARTTTLYRRTESGILVPIHGSEALLDRMRKTEAKKKARPAGVSEADLESLRWIVKNSHTDALATRSKASVSIEAVTAGLWAAKPDPAAALRKLRKALRDANVIGEDGSLTDEGLDLIGIEGAA